MELALIVALLILAIIVISFMPTELFESGNVGRLIGCIGLVLLAFAFISAVNEKELRSYLPKTAVGAAEAGRYTIEVEIYVNPEGGGIDEDHYLPETLKKISQ